MTNDSSTFGVAEIDVRVFRHGGQVVVTLRGEADLATVPQLDRLFAGLDAARGTPVVLDVAGLDFIDCAAVGSIARFRARGADVRFRGAGPVVQLVLDAVGWADLADR